MNRDGHPTFRHICKGKVGVVRNSQVHDLRPQFGQATIREFAVLSFEGAAKLLVTSFEQSVIPATRLQPIEVFRHPMKHHLPSILTLAESVSFHAGKNR